MIYLHLSTKHDTNGNPRRLFLILNEKGDPINAIDEGYAGNSQVRKEHPDAVAGPRIEVTISEYRGWLRWAKEKKNDR